MEVAEIRGGVPEGLRVGAGSTGRDRTLFPVLQSPAAAPEPCLSNAGRDPPAGVTPMKGARHSEERPEWRGAPFALLHGHRACQGVCQGFPDGAPQRRVLARHPGMLNAAEMRAKGEVWKGRASMQRA